MPYDVRQRNHDVTVTVPAKLLDNLIALALGYSQSGGHWLNNHAIAREAQEMLYATDYEVWGDSLFKYDSKTGTFILNSDIYVGEKS